MSSSFDAGMVAASGSCAWSEARAAVRHWLHAPPLPRALFQDCRYVMQATPTVANPHSAYQVPAVRHRVSLPASRLQHGISQDCRYVLQATLAVARAPSACLLRRTEIHLSLLLPPLGAPVSVQFSLARQARTNPSQRAPKRMPRRLLSKRPLQAMTSGHFFLMKAQTS